MNGLLALIWVSGFFVTIGVLVVITDGSGGDDKDVVTIVNIIFSCIWPALWVAVICFGFIIGVCYVVTTGFEFLYRRFWQLLATPKE